MKNLCNTYNFRTFTPGMIDERMFNLLRDQLSTAQAEKVALYTQITSLTAEIRMLREENKRFRTEDKDVVKQLQSTLSSVKSQLEAALSLLEKKDEVISILNQELANERDRNFNNNRKTFGRTSEQARLLNNRNVDERSQEKASFDGDSVEKSNDDTPTETPSKETKKKKRPRGRKNKSEDKFVNETVMHKLSDYYTLPKGGHYMRRNGEIETYVYEYTEYYPARVVRHLYEVARVAMPDGETIVSTLPEELRKASAKGCPFDAKMMAFILCEKYAYHSPINTVKKKLRDMGAIFSKTTLNRYYHKGVESLFDCFDSTLRSEIHKSNYLMVDETCEVVGIKNDNGEISYKKKYLWAFLDKAKKLVHYIYEKGSRGLSVVEDYLKGWKGSISTDGYAAYKAFSKKHPDILHIGCWAHTRRLYVESLTSDRVNSMAMIEAIAELFDIEYYCRLLDISDDDRKLERQKKSRPILAKIYIMARSMYGSPEVMANPTMAKAVKYTLNQWDNLRNFILDGKAEISNNLVEQRMKPIKLDLKNSQIIGSENAAKRHAFMHSIIESCSMNNITPYKYLVDLLERYKMVKEEEKPALMPCYYKNNLKN